MTWSKSTTRVSDAQALWTYQLTGKANIDALTSLFATESQSWEEIAEDIQQARAIDTAVGDQLDQLGALVGQPRNGLTDERYRVWLKARIYVNRSSGVPSEIYGAAYIILGQDADLFLRQIPVGHALVSRTKSTVVPGDLYTLLQSASAVTVPFQYWYPTWETTTGTNVFTFASGSSVVTGTTLGFDNGRLLALEDAYTPEEYDYIESEHGSGLIERIDFSSVSDEGSLNIPGTYATYSTVTSAPTIDPVGLKDRYSTVLNGAYSTNSFGGTLLETTYESRIFSVAGVARRIGGSGRAWEMKGTFNSEVTVRINPSLQLNIRDSSGSGTTFVGPSLPASDWFSFVITYSDSGVANFYLGDGTKVEDTGTPRIILVSDPKFTIYQIADWSGEQLVWDRVLTDEQAQGVASHLITKYTDTYK